jgi:hypothetical protein
MLSVPFLQSHDGMQVLSFDQFFTTIDADILPPYSGPYLLACYIQPWYIWMCLMKISISISMYLRFSVYIVIWFIDSAEKCKRTLHYDHASVFGQILHNLWDGVLTFSSHIEVLHSNHAHLFCFSKFLQITYTHAETCWKRWGPPQMILFQA